MKKILISLLAYDGGKSGIANYMYNTVVALSKTEEIDIIVNQDEQHYFNNISNNIKIRTISPLFKKPLLNVFWHMFVLPFTIKHLNYKWMFLPAGNRRLMLFYPLKTYVTMHDLSQLHIAKKYDAFRMFYIKYIIPFLLKGSHKIFTVSKSTANDLVRFYKIDQNKLIINYNGVNTDDFYPKVQNGLAKNRSYILFVSRIEHPGKNHLNLIKAYEKLPRTLKDSYNLYLAGSDWNGAEVVHNYAKSSPDKDKIIFSGFIDNSKLLEIYQGASLFVFPSFYEGFGIPIVEAMSTGIPVITSDTSSMPEVGGSAALYFDPNSIDDISLAMQTVLTNKKLSTQMIKKGLQQIKKFNWNTHAQLILDSAN